MNGFVPWLPVDSAPAGQRLAVKDVIDVAGMPTGAGHPTWLTTHELPAHDAVAVARLRSAFTVIGKTHTDELAYSLAGTNHHYGTPENPVAPGRVPGGSSSGSAESVAAARATLRAATDRILHELGDDGLLAMPSAPAAAPPIPGSGESPDEQPNIGSRTASPAETLSVGSSIPATGSVATTLPDGLGPADRAAVARLTCLAPVCGAPALSVPVAAIDGLPLGLSLLAAPGRDESLLATAELLG
ncbi:amidase family protein [Nocardia sp. NBC_00565]|uniref:amidase family protein n=1 Tax=Nocardia sp. NBC_00565 TaxID=2975993 RepID=UPI002E7FF321|nr:amidase family protein [Nocardia sp. NBC_00565]WUC06129.1 amidase family protein [Nocardia sp. NBC_00565]